MLTSSRYQWLSNVLLGVGTIVLFVGYDASSIIVESALRSVHRKDPARIEANAGYYGQAIIYGVYAPACLVAPLVVYWLGSRRTLLVTSFFFTFYILGFLFLTKFFYYASCAGVGLGLALYYAGQGCYMMEHSTKETVQRNSAMFSGYLNMSMIAGGTVLLVMSFTEMASLDTLRESFGYHEYTETMIRWIFGTFAVFGIAANLTFAFLPPRRVSDPSLSDGQRKFNVRAQLASIWHTLVARRMWLLGAMCVFDGVYTAFCLSVYPTTLTFTRALTHNKQLPGLYAIVFGTGIMIASVFSTLLSRRVANIGRWPSVVAFVVASLPAFILILLATPNKSSIEPNDGNSLLIQPSAWIALLVALLLSMGDVFKTTVRSVISATLYPERPAETFSISKLYQAIASSAMFFASTSLPIYWHVSILFVGEVIYLAAYYLIARKTAALKRQVTQAKSDQSHSVSQIRNT